MFIAFLTLLSALSISGVAIFYSVIGLATIFPGAFWPVIIMGSVLEVGKLITASWLYRHWKQTRFLLKTYLTISVIVLSLITSMGIFGFLSKAHLEQNLASENLTQRIDLINSKIVSQQTYIKRQNAIIERAEKSLTRTVGTNDEAIAIERQNLEDAQNKLKEAINIEKQSLADAEDKFKTLLTVETNTIKSLNDRLKILDADVTAILTQKNKAFFNEEKAAADLKASQKEERELIDLKINEAQGRINELKGDYATDNAIIQKRIEKLREAITSESAVIQARIEKLREGSVDDKSVIYIQIEVAEDNILKAQNSIDDLIIDREPLESEMIKLEAEVGPIKYIAALVIDWGVTNEVELNEAVRWVILLIIVVFDPLAVALLLAANQSLMRKFPVAPPPPPQEIVDLEKPEPYEPPFAPVQNDMAEKAKALAEQEKAEKIRKDWAVKLYEFNKERLAKRDKDLEEQKKVEETIPHIDLIGQKKTEEKEIVVDKDDGFDLDEVKYDIETKTKSNNEEQKAREKEEKEKQLEEFKKREQEEKENLERIAREAKEEEAKVTTVEEALKMPESESVETPIEEPERTRPDFTEVIEPTEPAGDGTFKTGTLGPKIKKSKIIDPKVMTDFERTGMLNKLHQEHGKYEDISDEALKKERDDANKAQFLADVALTEEEARNHPPMTESRMAYFQDHIDDILRGNSTFENIPPDIAKTVALLMTDEYPNPEIITKGSALKPEGDKNVETMTQDALKEKFMEQPETEERPITDEELDDLLEGFPERPKANEDYVQNEEQTDETLWQKTKELDLPEPEKNEIQIPELESTTEDIPVLVDKVKIENVIPVDKFTRYKKRLATDEEYHQRIEQRINNLITKLEAGEVKLNDLTNADQKAILDILNQ